MGKSVAIVGSRGYPSYYGGYETIVRRVSPYLADSGWDVTVFSRHDGVSLNDPNRDPRIKVRYSLGLEYKSLSTLTYGATGSLMAALSGFDLVFVCNVANAYWLPAFRARRIPVLLHADGIEWERDKWGATARSVFFRGAKLAARWADHVVHDSIEIDRRWQEELGARPGTVIYHGGDQPGPISFDEPGVVPGDFVLAVMRFVPENSIDTFLAAAEHIASTGRDVVLVGSSGYGGPYDEEARRLSSSYPTFHWLGHVSDERRLLALWSNCGAYFHGHSVGGTNPSLVQAMACGAPIVARDTPYNREVLGTAGVFISSETETVRSALLEMLGNTVKQKELRSATVSRALERNQWDLIGQQYVDLFNEWSR